MPSPPSRVPGTPDPKFCSHVGFHFPRTYGDSFGRAGGLPLSAEAGGRPPGPSPGIAGGREALQNADGRVTTPDGSLAQLGAGASGFDICKGRFEVKCPDYSGKPLGTTKQESRLGTEGSRPAADVLKAPVLMAPCTPSWEKVQTPHIVSPVRLARVFPPDG